MVKSPDQELKKAAISVGEKIENSKVFMSVYTQSYKEDPMCALQLGIAVMLGKPIAIIAEKGVVVPEVLARIASAVEVFVPDSKLPPGHQKGDSIKAAAGRLIKKMDLKP
jgi:hypothetical protein